jgi:hypothetical protein
MPEVAPHGTPQHLPPQIVKTKHSTFIVPSTSPYYNNTAPLLEQYKQDSTKKPKENSKSTKPTTPKPTPTPTPPTVDMEVDPPPKASPKPQQPKPKKPSTKRNNWKSKYTKLTFPTHTTTEVTRLPLYGTRINHTQTTTTTPQNIS